MGNLILKDILVQKKYFVAFILFSISIIFLYSHTDSPSNIIVIFIMLPVMITVTCITNMSIKDEKAENMINSLPVRRVDVILAKYLSVFVFTIIASGIIYISSTIMNFIGIVYLGRFMNIEDICAYTLTIVIISSFYLPINFKLGYTKARYILMALYMCIFFIPFIFQKLIGHKLKINPQFITYMNNAADWQIIFVTSFISAIVLIISFLISYYLYKNKDLV